MHNTLVLQKIRDMNYSGNQLHDKKYFFSEKFQLYFEKINKSRQGFKTVMDSFPCKQVSKF